MTSKVQKSPNLRIFANFSDFDEIYKIKPQFQKNVNRKRKICLQQNFYISSVPKTLKQDILPIVGSYVSFHSDSAQNQRSLTQSRLSLLKAQK